MIKIFGKEGELKDFHPSYEFRPQQLEMAEFITDRLYETENGLVEAGTGVGKTLAYLVPAILYCLENDKKLAVSTETKALQKQLVDKDLPLVAEIFKEFYQKEFTYALCLGSGNYLCRRRFELIVAGGKFSKSEMEKVAKLQEMIRQDEVFTRFDLRISNKLWNRVSREPDACGYQNCPYVRNCVFQRARREWAQTDLLVMNHHLFFTNIMSGRTYLPQFDIAIFDEAHSVEEIASTQFGFNISQTNIMELLARFHKPRSKKSILRKITSESIRTKAIDSVKLITTELSSFFEELRGRLGPADTIRLREKVESGSALIKEFKTFFSHLDNAEEFIEDDADKIEYDILRGRLFLVMQNLISGSYLEKEDNVYWIEKSGDALIPDVHLRGQPIDISGLMMEEVISSYSSTFYFSATLAINGNFSFIEKRLGISRCKNLILTSPFDYRNQVQLYISKNNANPSDAQYIDSVVQQSASLIESTGGNCLLLFTSYKMLNDVRERLSEIIPNPLYSQGQMPINEVLERFIEDKGSVLLGTHSFWQGIDLPGDLLKGVILMRLPFSVPDNPVVQAKMEQLENSGQNPFYHYQIPSAIIRFKQGFGRLIRSKSDRGVVAVLDPRIHTKSYGKLFLRSLPECNVVYSLEDLNFVNNKMKVE